ncbi:MAG: hypothetical protein ACRDFQ_08855 [Anaerolineales bacterium]
MRPRNFVLIIALIVGCGQPQASISEPLIRATSVVRGYGISPLGFPADYSRFPEFLQEVAELPGGGVMFNGAWREDVANGTDAGEIPQTANAIMEQSEIYGFIPIIVFGWRSDDGNVHISVPDNPVG